MAPLAFADGLKIVAALVVFTFAELFELDAVASPMLPNESATVVTAMVIAFVFDDIYSPAFHPLRDFSPIALRHRLLVDNSGKLINQVGNA
jgi:hypothetical protein